MFECERPPFTPERDLHELNSLAVISISWSSFGLEIVVIVFQKLSTSLSPLGVTLLYTWNVTYQGQSHNYIRVDMILLAVLIRFDRNSL